MFYFYPFGTFILWDAFLYPLIVLFWFPLFFLKTKRKEERIQGARNRVDLYKLCKLSRHGFLFY